MLGKLRNLCQFVNSCNVLFQSRDIRLGCSGVGFEIVDGVEVLLRSGLEVGVRPLDGDQSLGLLNQAVADGLLAEVHAEAMLRVVLEQGVAPCGTLAFCICAVRVGSARVAPDGGAAGGVGDIHLVAEQLCDQTRVACLGTACAGAGELKQRLAELAALDVSSLEFLLLGNLVHAVIEDVLLIQLRLLRNHLDSLNLFGAGADTDAAAHAVERRDGHGELINAFTLTSLDRDDLSSCGCVLGFLIGQRDRADGSVRADISAVAALDALCGIPFRNCNGNAALFVSGSAQLELSINMIDERGNRQRVAVHLIDREEDVLNLLDKFGLAFEVMLDDNIFCVRPVSGNVDLHIGGSAGVDGLVVHLDDVHALLGVGLCGLFLHVLDGVLFRQNLGQGEERGLKDGVGALAHADGLRQINGVDGVKLDVVLGNVALGSGIQMMSQFFRCPLTVNHKHAARLDVTDNGETLRDVGRVMAGDEVGLVDVIRALDGLVTEAQMADGDAAGLLGVVLEVGLHILVGMVADDLDRVLVCADSAVAAQTPELALDGAFCGGVRAVLVLFEREVRHVVHDADGELMLRLVLLQFVVNSEDGSRRRILGAEAVAAANDGSLDTCVGQSGHNVHVQRLAQRAGLLRAVEDCNLLGGSRDGCDQLVCTERTVQANLNQADFLAVCVHVVDNFLSNVVDGAHRNNDAVSVGGAVVVEQLVVRAEFLIDLAHVLFDNCGQFVIVPVAGLAVLEEDITVFMAAAGSGMLRVQRMLTELLNSLHVAHFFEVGVVPAGDLLDLVGGTEAVKEVQERNLALDRSQMRDRGQIHDFLRVGLAEHGEAGLTAGHDVRVITENVQSMGRDGTRRDVEYAGQLLRRDLVHVRDHQQQTLRRRVGGRQSTCAEGAVNRTGRTSLRLHLSNLDAGAKDVLQTCGRPLVNEVRHRGGRRNGINTGDLCVRIGYMSRSIVAVHGFEFTNQNNYLLKVITYSCTLTISHFLVNVNQIWNNLFGFGGNLTKFCVSFRQVLKNLLVFNVKCAMIDAKKKAEGCRCSGRCSHSAYQASTDMRCRRNATSARDFRRSIWSACRMRPLKRRASGCAPRSKTAVSGFLSAVLS